MDRLAKRFWRELARTHQFHLLTNLPVNSFFGCKSRDAVVGKAHVAQEVDTLAELPHDDLPGVQRKLEAVLEKRLYVRYHL